MELALELVNYLPAHAAELLLEKLRAAEVRRRAAQSRLSRAEDRARARSEVAVAMERRPTCAIVSQGVASDERAARTMRTSGKNGCDSMLIGTRWMNGCCVTNFIMLVAVMAVVVCVAIALSHLGGCSLAVRGLPAVSSYVAGWPGALTELGLNHSGAADSAPTACDLVLKDALEELDELRMAREELAAGYNRAIAATGPVIAFVSNLWRRHPDENGTHSIAAELGSLGQECMEAAYPGRSALLALLPGGGWDGAAHANSSGPAVRGLAPAQQPWAREPGGFLVAQVSGRLGLRVAARRRV